MNYSGLSRPLGPTLSLETADGPGWEGEALCPGALKPVGSKEEGWGWGHVLPLGWGRCWGDRKGRCPLVEGRCPVSIPALQAGQGPLSPPR